MWAIAHSIQQFSRWSWGEKTRDMLHLGLMTLYLDASCAWCAMLMHVHQERVLFFGGYVGITVRGVVV